MKLLRALGSGTGITLIVTVILSLCLWFLGSYFAFGEARPFETLLGRFVGLSILWICALVVLLIIALRDRKKDQALAEDIVESAETTDSDYVSEELDEMRGKLKTAMARLRKTQRGRAFLYQLPWYIIIGPPGAGKTTAIVNSGLQFPLADSQEATSLAGVGGTRNCDWWFTENAVLVDTAGRYTTQESDAQADNAAWLGFLGLLKKHRKRQPINGAIVAISLSDLAMQDETSQKNHAQAVRRRLRELYERLGVRFPVYILFTKADLIAGFSEYFDGLPKEAREQVWGFTLPVLAKGAQPFAPAVFDGEFDALLDRLNQQTPARMQAEVDAQRRSMIASFPAQFAAVRDTARDFLSELFIESKLDGRQLLRGVYFTSGTQEGTPIDRLMMGMARTFGIGRQAIGSGRGTGRSYFLTNLFDGMIFREAGLVSLDDAVERRYRWAKRGAFAAVLLAAVGMGTLWGRSYLGNLDLIEQTGAQVSDYRTQAEFIAPSPVGDTDLLAVVPALNTLRDMPSNPAQGEVAMPTGLGFGLYQGQVLGNEQALTYRSALNTHFLPRLLLRLENQMQASVNDPDALYQTLKVYLMLGQVGPMNSDLIHDWMRQDWEAAFPDSSREDLRTDLDAHLATLLSAPMQPIALNNDLVQAVQGILTQMPQAQRVYNGIINSEAANALPDFRLTDVGGPAVARAFVRSSGKRLNDGIPGIYTRQGFYKVFLEQALSVSARIQSESWVLGEAVTQDQSEAILVNMSRDVLGLYYNDFILQYDTLLGDIDVIPMKDLPSAVEVTNVLSGTTSPVLNILTAVADQTRLTEPLEEAEDSAAAAPNAATTAIAQQAAKKLKVPKLAPAALKTLEAMNQPRDGAAAVAMGQPVESNFAWLHQLTDRPDGQASQLDVLIDALKEVYQDLSNLNFADGIGNPQDKSTALPRFQAEVGRIEEGPLKRWASQITVGSSGVATEGTRAGIDARWQSDVVGLCTRVTTNTYPFEKRATTDAGLAEFAELFRPDGKIDGFFKTNLAQYVDTGTRPWSFRQVNNTDLGISPAVLKQFENAALIRDAFFVGSAALNVQFQITPEALDPQARGILLDIDGQQVEYRRRDRVPRAFAIRWPGPVGSSRVSFTPEKRNSESMIRRDGSWAWFRMMDIAAVRATDSPNRHRLIFNLGGRIAIFQMESSAAINPFNLRALSEFRCPQSM